MEKEDKIRKITTCITDVELNDYLEGVLSNEKKVALEEHLKDCGECLEKIEFAHNVIKSFGRSKRGESEVGMKSKNYIWLTGAVISFILSFIVSQYFLQFLIATVIFALKWIFESVNARILIMIYEAWKKGGEKEASKILKTFDRKNI